MIPALAIAAALVACSPQMSPPPYAIAGIPVAYEWESLLAGTAGATWRDGRCVVLLHPERWWSLSPAEQWWTLGHELAHCEGAATELEADCAGIAWLAGRGLVTDEGLARIVERVADYPASEAHPPGAVRAARVLECAGGTQ